MPSEAYQFIGGIWQICRPERRLNGAWATAHEVHRYEGGVWVPKYTVEAKSPGGASSGDWTMSHQQDGNWVCGSDTNLFSVTATFKFDPSNAGLPYTAEWFEATQSGGPYTSLGVQNGYLDESTTNTEGTGTGWRNIPWFEQRFYRVYVSVMGTAGNYSPEHAVTDNMVFC